MTEENVSPKKKPGRPPKDKTSETNSVQTPPISYEFNSFNEMIPHSQYYFGFNIFEIEKFNIKTFNRCENENRIMFVTENSKKVYPFCKCIPLSKTYPIPFGLYYSKNANLKTKELIETIKSYSPEN